MQKFNTLPMLTAAYMSVGLPYSVFDKHFEMNTTLKIAAIGSRSQIGLHGPNIPLNLPIIQEFYS
jgi:hypothetical protein